MAPRYDRIELRHLRYFLACAEQGSVRRAAEVLGMAQPPLGRQIRQLEQEIGATLFLRSAAGLALTEAGRELQIHAREILERMRFAADETRMTAHGVAGSLSVGYIDDFLFGLLPRAISTFTARFDRVTLRLDMSPSHPIITGVLDGQTDVGFAVTPLPASTAHLSVAAFRPTPLLAALPAGHRLAGRSSIALADLAEDTMIWSSQRPDSGFYQHVAALLQGARINPRVIPNIWPSNMILNLVADGRGVSMLTRDSVNWGRSDVALVPFDDPAVAVHRVMFWDAQRLRNSVRAFLAVCDETLADELLEPLAPAILRQDAARSARG